MYTGWGASDTKFFVVDESYKFTLNNVTPGWYQIINEWSVPILWLRGGGKYHVRADYACSWSPKTTTYKYNTANVSVAPTKTAGQTVVGTATGDISRQISSLRTTMINGLLKFIKHNSPTITIGANSVGVLEVMNSTSLANETPSGFTFIGAIPYSSSYGDQAVVSVTKYQDDGSLYIQVHNRFGASLKYSVSWYNVYALSTLVK